VSEIIIGSELKVVAEAGSTYTSGIKAVRDKIQTATTMF